MTIKELLTKLKKYLISKPESKCPPAGPPDTDEFTKREITTVKDEKTNWFSWTFRF